MSKTTSTVKSLSTSLFFSDDKTENNNKNNKNENNNKNDENNNKINIKNNIKNYKKDGEKYKVKEEYFGTPFFLEISRSSTTLKELYCLIYEKISFYLKDNFDLENDLFVEQADKRDCFFPIEKLFSIKVVDTNDHSIVINEYFDLDSFVVIGNGQSIVLDWDLLLFRKFVDPSKLLVSSFFIIIIIIYYYYNLFFIVIIIIIISFFCNYYLLLVLFLFSILFLY